MDSKTFRITVISTLFIFILSLTASAAPKKRKLEGLINSFEKLASETEIGDFDWETNGYVQLEQFKKYGTKGKYSAKATFSVPADFVSNTVTARIGTWVAPMTMSINTLTKLKITDWSVFKKFAVDVYMPEGDARDFYIKLFDSNGKEYVALRPLKNGRNKLEIKIEDVKNARINTTNITSFTLYLDTKNEPADVVLYVDYIRLVP